MRPPFCSAVRSTTTCTKIFGPSSIGPPKDRLVVTELSTLGGDPEEARMMGEDFRFHSDNSPSGRFASSERPRSTQRGLPS